MLVLILSIPYFIFIYYIYRRGYSWSKACIGKDDTKLLKWGLAFVFLFMALSPAIAFFLPAGNARHVMNIFANFNLAVFIYLGGIMLIGDLIRIIAVKTGLVKNKIQESRRVFAAAGGMIIVLVVTTCIYGGIHSKDIRLDKRTAVIHKELSCEAEQSEKPKENDQKMTVAVVSDLHLAYNTGLKEVRSVVKYINEMDADLVCMPGDFFTNVYDDVREPEAIISELRKIKSRYGVFGCWGNHDVDEPILAGFTFSAFMEGEPVHDPEMVSFLKKANIKMLEDEYVLIDDSFYVAGRLDAEKPGVSTGNADQEIKRKPLSDVLKGVDKTKPIIMIDHEPRELPETARAGVDLDISGHTHNGQFFPLNLTQYFIWPNPYGIQLYSKNGEEIDAAKTAKGKYGDPETEHIDTMTSFVTSGAGVYGPNMRVGTDSEVVRLEVTFRK